MLKHSNHEEQEYDNIYSNHITKLKVSFGWQNMAATIANMTLLVAWLWCGNIGFIVICAIDLGQVCCK